MDRCSDSPANISTVCQRLNKAWQLFFYIKPSREFCYSVTSRAEQVSNNTTNVTYAGR